MAGRWGPACVRNEYLPDYWAWGRRRRRGRAADALFVFLLLAPLEPQVTLP